MYYVRRITTDLNLKQCNIYYVNLSEKKNNRYIQGLHYYIYLVLPVLRFRFVKEKLSPEIRTETQLLFLCHLVGPFLQRFNSDLSRTVMDITITLYELLANIDKAQPHLLYIDPICDLLYPFNFVIKTQKIFSLFYIPI